jgi:hypothetical protein
VTFEEGKDAILAVFLAAWGNRPMTFNDVPAVVTSSQQVWARATVRHADGGQDSLTGGLGTVRYKRKGVVWIQVFAPVGDGETAGLIAAQLLVNAYQDAQTDVWYRNVRMSEAGADGAFQRFDVKADFEYSDVR